MARKKISYKTTNGTNFYLKYTSKNKLQFPVTPPELTISSPFGVPSVKVVHKGEFTQTGFRELKTIEFSSFFPRRYHPSYCTYKFKKGPDWHRHRIEAYRDKRKPLYFVVPGLRISMKVLIDDFQIKYKAEGDPGDIHFTIKLKQYKDPPKTLLKKKKPSKSNGKGNKSDSKTTGKKSDRPKSSTKFEVKKGQTHTVKINETLQIISKKYYGVTTKWRDIYDLNRKVIGANPNIIKTGMKLVIRKK